MHIRPWEIGLMTVDQFDRACAYVDTYVDEMKKGVGK